MRPPMKEPPTAAMPRAVVLPSMDQSSPVLYLPFVNAIAGTITSDGKISTRHSGDPGGENGVGAPTTLAPRRHTHSIPPCRLCFERPMTPHCSRSEGTKKPDNQLTGDPTG